MFAGGGFVRQALAKDWSCVLANDINPLKERVYIDNFGDAEFNLGDIAELNLESFRHREIDLLWGSFPCQDLSLAGPLKGLSGGRSSAFWSFMLKLRELTDLGSKPKIITLENVPGFLAVNNGADFSVSLQAMRDAGYTVGASIIDAKNFTLQSRKRVFIIGVANEFSAHKGHIFSIMQNDKRQPARLNDYYSNCNSDKLFPLDLSKKIWREEQIKSMSELIDDTLPFFSAEKTDKLLALLPPTHRARLEKLESSDEPQFYTASRRMRDRKDSGKRVQQLEVRNDNLISCIRTLSGGSSEQYLIRVFGGQIKIRRLSVDEVARAMGCIPSFKLPDVKREAYQVLGDAVVVPVVRCLATELFSPFLESVQESLRPMPRSKVPEIETT